ncbi:hypothetical protein GRI39_10010 [Altererythrobacter indicus]|uniref:Tetratricopeptide repeat protein n=1 Tax=Altericroceibacterium indicum TaxID=374177 RepID=A0A845ABJ8_9SPHN|nr:tetratricopeptide repeat protein [Altericroceibacterium indicum]MXP26371.1 hypothetical protein [Altericroceibacterium indicum]
MSISLPLAMLAPLLLLQSTAGGVPGSSSAPLPQDIGRDDTTLPPMRRRIQAKPTIEQDRLSVCLDNSRRDPATAIVNASTWLAEVTGAERSFPQQCLGMAYVSLLRWDAAENAFLAARNFKLDDDHVNRARLAGMAGNAAMAASHAQEALNAFDLAIGDAEKAGDTVLAGTLSADRARALVQLNRDSDAETALNKAITDAPQNPTGWLLLATLERREGKLAEAAEHIRTAGGLAPHDPAIALEAGVIAALAGDDDTARKNWHAVIDMAASDSAEATNAKAYLAQLKQEDQP